MENDSTPVRVYEKDNTVYIVEYAIGENAKETVQEKIKRLILNEPIVLAKKVS